ncbi:RING-CH-type domain-containing protein [Forsythia ovata]|uniref:RING-CH-type domain-containing protein n=1 Tax=Forsythia ovata TaxID=205694 RepID=A0ABD1SA98_9LAMI
MKKLYQGAQKSFHMVAIAKENWVFHKNIVLRPGLAREKTGLSSTKHAVPCRLCEICGKTVKNITSNLEDSSIFMMEWNEMRMVATTLDTSQESSRRCKKSMSNFLMACSILAFVLPWFFRVDIL